MLLVRGDLLNDVLDEDVEEQRPFAALADLHQPLLRGLELGVADPVGAQRAVHALKDHSAVHLLEQLAGEVAVLSAAVRRPLTLIAESDLNDPKLITPREANGYGLDGQWSTACS